METCCKPVEPCLAEDLILALIVRITFTRLHRLDTPAANVRLSFGQGVGAAGRLKHIERAANGTTDDSLLLFASFHFLYRTRNSISSLTDAASAFAMSLGTAHTLPSEVN